MSLPRQVKIVATIGPSSRREDILLRMIEAGMNVARVNFSHGTYEDHAASIRMIRKAATISGVPVGILQDLQGVKIRVGEIREGSISLEDGQPFILTTRSVPGDEKAITVSWASLPQDVKPGHPILLDDGRLWLRVKSIHGSDIHTEVEHGGVLTPRKGVNLPETQLVAPSLTEKDKSDLQFGLANEVDAVAISFVRNPVDVKLVRQLIIDQAPERANLPLISKFERREALDQMDAIIEISDGVMVARGDLGVETSVQDVPIIQKKLIQSANRKGKLVITATQMLESMISNPQPTRAEASDVANAVFDGTDAVMLSGETAIGAYPVETIRTMASILCEAEEHLADWGRWHGYASGENRDNATAIAHAAAELANDRDAAAVAVFTHLGRSARLMSKARPCAPILAFTPNPENYRRMSMLWGVHPTLVPPADSVEGMIAHVEKALLSSGPIHPGEQVVLVASIPMALHGTPNFVLLHTVGDQG